MSKNSSKALLKDAPDTDLAETLRRLAKKNPELAKAANAELNGLRSEVEEKVKAASEVDETNEKQLSREQAEELLKTVKARFEVNMHRHEDMEWSKVQARLEGSPEKMWSLNEMERTGGEPDVVGYDKKNGEYIFYDCSKKNPEGRRNICYDRKGQDEADRRGYNPKGNAVDMAASMGIEILTRKQYLELQELEQFDYGTWSWLKTSAKKRKAGVAVHGIRGTFEVYVRDFYSYYFSDDRAFRGSLRV